MANYSSIEKVISAEILRTNEDNLLANKVCNTSYVGDIKNRGDSYTSYGNDFLYSVKGAIYIMSADGSAAGTVPECVWEAKNISPGSEGRADITGFFTDVSISGDVKLKLTFTPGDGSGAKNVTFAYPAGTNRSFRLECRPMLKRVGPFGIRMSVSGAGDCDIHGMGIVIRNRERNYRNGISKRN